MDFQLGGELVQSIKRLPYKVWFALAEYIDNSTQAYENNKDTLDELFAKEGEVLTVKIDYDPLLRCLVIEDNSVGMSKSELEHAVTMGKPPKNTDGRSKYGMGLKTASFWLGNFWTVTTKKRGENIAHYVEADLGKIVKNNLDLSYREIPEEIDRHYTVIKVFDLLRNFTSTRAISKTKDYLKSIYRVDISEGKLKLIYRGEELKWDKDEILSKLEKNFAGQPLKQDFQFMIGKKHVRGWAGILEDGSRNNAGFSILQHDRVIVGWPDSYRPGLLFGFQEGGSNTLVNQRLVGELHMDDFDVSHTKDAILFENDEEDTLDLMLRNELASLKAHALKSKLKMKAEDGEAGEERMNEALVTIQSELSSRQMSTFLFSLEVPPLELIELSNFAVIDSVMKRVEPTFSVTINNRLYISLYVRPDLSPNDPYVLVEATGHKDKLIIIVNTSHPYWQEMKSNEIILHYLRHCVYDGVAEWKAYDQSEGLQPDTITWIKDNLLRVPFKMDLN